MQAIFGLGIPPVTEGETGQTKSMHRVVIKFAKGGHLIAERNTKSLATFLSAGF